MIRDLLYILSAMVVQGVFIPLVNVYTHTPDIIFITLLYIYLRNSVIYGTLFGFIIGLFIDLNTSSYLGQSALVYSLLGFSLGWFNGKKMQLDYFVKLIIITVSFFVGNFLFYVIDILKSSLPISSIGEIIVVDILPRLLYSILIFSLVEGIVFSVKNSTFSRHRYY